MNIHPFDQYDQIAKFLEHVTLSRELKGQQINALHLCKVHVRTSFHHLFT